jgi:hypothetical protein
MSITRGPWRGPPCRRPITRSISFAGVQQLLGVANGPHPQAGVEELRLVQELPDRLGVVRRGGGENLDAGGFEEQNRSLEVGTPIPDVRADAEVAEAGLGGAVTG